MAMWVMPVAGGAPCQCFSLGANQITSPGWMGAMGPSQRCAQPAPAVTMRVWPRGCVCHAVRAPGSKVTLAPWTRAGSGAWKRGSTRTLPVAVYNVLTFEQISWGPLAAAALIVTAPVLLLTLLMQKEIVAGLTAEPDELVHAVDAARDLRQDTLG